MAEAGGAKGRVSTAIGRGRRDRQEDALACDVPDDGSPGILVVADGCGGHTGGAIASRAAAAAALDHLVRRRAEGALDPAPGGAGVPAALRAAVEIANAAVLAEAALAPTLADMRTTLVAAVETGGALYWASVGDSPLFLLRAGWLSRLNALHSLAAHLDLLASIGEIELADAEAHPARNVLTSALGAARIERIDCPETPLALAPGDVVLAASDGILTLSKAAIAEAVAPRPTPSAETPAERLLRAVERGAETDQDNVAVVVLHVEAATGQAAAPSAPNPPALAAAGGRLRT